MRVRTGREQHTREREWGCWPLLVSVDHGWRKLSLALLSAARAEKNGAVVAKQKGSTLRSKNDGRPD